MEYDGAVGMGYIEDKETLTVRQVTFAKDGATVEPTAVDPVALSETLRDILQL